MQNESPLHAATRAPFHRQLNESDLSYTERHLTESSSYAQLASKMTPPSSIEPNDIETDGKSDLLSLCLTHCC